MCRGRTQWHWPVHSCHLWSVQLMPSSITPSTRLAMTLLFSCFTGHWLAKSPWKGIISKPSHLYRTLHGSFQSTQVSVAAKLKGLWSPRWKRTTENYNYLRKNTQTDKRNFLRNLRLLHSESACYNSWATARNSRKTMHDCQVMCLWGHHRASSLTASTITAMLICSRDTFNCYTTGYLFYRSLSYEYGLTGCDF